jgi:hypothetical protein
MHDSGASRREIMKSCLEQEQTPSFRGDAKHRTRNLEIPRCAIAHLRSGPADHPGMTVSGLHVIASEAKQSISLRKERMDCFASLAMTALQLKRLCCLKIESNNKPARHARA